MTREHRAHLDMAASWGVPAHVSVVHPFVPPADVDDATAERDSWWRVADPALG